MSYVFTSSDYRKIGKILGVKPRHQGNNVRYELGVAAEWRKLTLEIYAAIPIGKKRGNLVTVYTRNSHLQLHFCSGFVVSPMLNEVTFIGESAGKLSGLIVEKEGGCSLYSNVDRAILSGDLTNLGPEIMLSGIALSLGESILPAPAKRTARRRK
jgi:hypothetical protein